MLKAMTVTNRPCFAGWTLAPTGEAYDFQGRCVVGGDTGQYSSRMCRLPYYQHSAGGAYYDIQGFCDPTKTAIPGQSGIAAAASSWMTWVIVGGVAYLVWKYRKKLF